MTTSHDGVLSSAPFALPVDAPPPSKMPTRSTKVPSAVADNGRDLEIVHCERMGKKSRVVDVNVIDLITAAGTATDKMDLAPGHFFHEL